MPREQIDCPSCGSPVRWDQLRSWFNGERNLVVCKGCYLELVKEYPGTGKRKPKLVDQPSDGEQPELPF